VTRHRQVAEYCKDCDEHQRPIKYWELLDSLSNSLLLRTQLAATICRPVSSVGDFENVLVNNIKYEEWCLLGCYAVWLL
jgi:hypothetical protein